MNNLSSSAYNLYERVWLTNEIPPMYTYGLLNRQLKNKWSADLIGISKVNYESSEYESIKTVRGTKSSNYKADYIEYINTDGDTVAAVIEKPNFEVNGLLGTELDYLTHEMHRYLFRLYPEHKNALYTLTENERLAYFQEAGYMINSSFDLSNLKVEDSEEETFYKYHKFITNVTTARKYTGSLQQEVMLLNLLGENNIVKNCDYYVTDAGTGVITNPYTGAESVDLRKCYEFLTSDSFAASFSDTLFANTEDSFKFAVEASLTTESKVSASNSILSFRETEDIYKEIKDKCDTIYKYSSGDEGDFLIPCSTDFTVSDLISEYAGIKIVKEYDAIQFVNSYENQSAVVPMVNGEFTMDALKALQGKRVTDAFTMEDIPSAICFQLGDLQYNKTFLQWISLFIYQRLIKSFEDSGFSVKYTGCLREEKSSNPIPWQMTVTVTQGAGTILKGVLSKDFITKCYENVGNEYDVGTGESYNPGEITPDFVFSHLVNPKNMEAFQFGNTNFNINLTLSRFENDPVLDSDVLDPQYGIPYVYETDEYPAFSEEWMTKGQDTEGNFKDDFWPVKDYLANSNYSVASIGDFSLVMNTVEMEYENMFKVYSNFDRYATVVMYSQEDTNLNRIFFFNQVKLAAYNYSEATLSQLTSDNICDYLYEEVELANTRLLKTEGYAIDETHIKVEKDITDLIKKYGKVDFLLLNCKGDKFFGKLDQAYIQGTYCVARIDQMSKDFDLDDWLETKIYVYIWRKTNDLFEDREISTVEGEDLQESLTVRPAQYNSISYFIANVKALSAANYKYLYDNIFSEDPSVFFTTSMKSHKLYEPTTLSKYESVLGIPGGDLNLLKVAETLINEHKSLYLDSDVYSNMVVPYVGKSVCYSGDSQALSSNYNTTHLPAYAFFSNIDLDDYPDFQSLYNAAVNADEKDMGYIETTYNNHLVIWGDIVWDKNEVDNVKRLRTIWSSFLSTFVIEDLKDRFPTYAQIKSADSSNPVTIRINNFNYSYNDGLPTTAYNLTIPGFKDPEVTINCSIQYLNNDSTVQTTTDTNPVLFAETDEEDYNDLSTAFKFMLPADNENLSYKESQISLSKCQLDLGTYYKVYCDSSLDPKITTDCELMVGDYKVKAISSWIEDSSFSHQTSYFASSSDVLELLAQQLVAGYVYETSKKSAVTNIKFSVQDILEHYIASSWGAVPCALYVNSNNRITAIIMNVVRTNEAPSDKYYMVGGVFYEIHIQEFEIPSIPEIYETTLGNSSNVSYLYEDSDLVKTIQSILTEEGNYIPLGTDGYFKEVDIDSNGKDIFSNSELYSASSSTKGSKVSSVNPLYTDKKVITSDLVSYQNESSSFILTDKRNGEVNEYSFVHNEKYFKDYEAIKFGISLDEDDSDENAIHKDVLFQLPSGIAFEDDDNIILHNIRTPVTRSLYSLTKEIKLIDRRYNLPVSNVIAYDDSSIYLKSNNLAITDVESIIESITPTNTAHTSQPIPEGTTVTFGKHWKPSETGIGYKYYKRKFMAKGTVYADNPSRIEFDDLDITLSEHISTGDAVQVLVVTPLSKSVEQKYYILKGLKCDSSRVNDGFEMTWKLLMGEATQSRDGNGEIVYDIYLAGVTSTGVNLYRVTMSTNESSSSTSLIKTINNATDIFNKDGKWYVVTTSSYNTSSKEISLTESTEGLGLYLDNHVNEFNVASGVTTTGDTDFNEVSLETKEGYPVISPVTVCIKINDSTMLLGDIYGRWIKEVVASNGSITYTLLNDPGFVEKQPIDSMEMTVDNFAALLGGYIPLYGIDLETATQEQVANAVIADIDDSSSSFYVDPSTLSRQAVGMYDLFGCKNAIGVTVKNAINQALLTYPSKESLTLPVYTGVMPFDVTKEIWKISQGTGKISASNFNTVAPYLVAADIDLTQIKQASAYSIDKENDLAYIFDKNTCMVYVINYADGGCTTIPMWKWLGITHETSWDKNNTYPLLTPAAVIPTREDTDKETAWNNYKTFINSLNASSFAKVADAFNQARDANSAYADYPDFNLTDFNAWVTKMENLLYLNAGEAWAEYSSCPWKPDTLKELAEDSGNIFNIAWTDILKDIVPEPDGLATFSATDITMDSYYKIADNVVYAAALKTMGYVDDEGYFIDPETSAKIPYYKNIYEVQNICEEGVKNYNNMAYYLSLANIGYDESISAKLEAIGNDTTDPEAALKDYLMQLQMASDDNTGTLMPEFTNLTPGSLLLAEGMENVRITSLIGNLSFESKIASVQIMEDSDNNQFIIYGALLPPNDGDNTTVYQNYTADASGYYPFAFSVNLSTKAISQIENKSKLLSAINYNDAWYGEDYNTSSSFTSDNNLSDLFGETSNGSANTASMNVPSGLIWKSGLFEEVVFTTSGIKFKNQYSSIELADMVTGKVSKIGADYFAFSGNELDFDNVESATVIAMVENNTKDNFKLGYGDTTLIALLPETISVFSVNEYRYADFASVLNAYNINASSGGYNPIFENGDYPYITDIAQNNLLPNFYECDFDSDTQLYTPKVLTNSLGRRILPMYPMMPYFDGKVIPVSDLDSVVLNKAYSTPGSLFKVEDGTYKYLTDVNTFADMPESSDDTTSVYSGVVMPSTLGKDYWDIEGGAGTLYKMVSDPKGALLSKCYATFEKTFGADSSIEAGEDYVKISGLTIKDQIGSDVETYRNANNRLNTTGAITTNTMITVESLSFKVTYKTATFPTEVPITQFTRTTSVIKTTLDEIAIPLGGYGCTIAQVGNGYFDPEYPSEISESIVTAAIEAGEDDPRETNVGCRFASGLFFGKGSLTNKNGDTFKIYVGEDSDGNPIYNNTFFGSHKLTYNSFYAADSALDEKLSPAWEIDAEYVLPDLYFTVNDNCKATNNIIKFTYNELKEEWGEFDYDDETTYPDVIYQMAVYGKTWSCEYFTKSKTLDESSSALYKELSELINIGSASTLKTIAAIKEFIGHTRRYNGSLATTIPMNLRHYDETSKTMLRSIKFTGEDATSTAQGLDPDSKLIFACTSDGVLYRIKNDSYGTIEAGGYEGDLINAAAIGETETDIRLATITKNGLSISGCSGLKISVSRVTVKRVAGGLKFVSDGNLSYLYVYNPETLSSGSCSMRWVDTSNDAEEGDPEYANFSELSGENYDCNLAFSKDVEFTYAAQTDNEYNYIILFDKDMNVVGQVYLGIAISPKTLISYIRA